MDLFRGGIRLDRPERPGKALRGRFEKNLPFLLAPKLRIAPVVIGVAGKPVEARIEVGCDVEALETSSRRLRDCVSLDEVRSDRKHQAGFDLPSMGHRHLENFAHLREAIARPVPVVKEIQHVVFRGRRKTVGEVPDKRVVAPVAVHDDDLAEPVARDLVEGGLQEIPQQSRGERERARDVSRLRDLRLEVDGELDHRLEPGGALDHRVHLETVGAEGHMIAVAFKTSYGHHAHPLAGLDGAPDFRRRHLDPVHDTSP